MTEPRLADPVQQHLTETDPIIAINDDLIRNIQAENYVATIEPTRRVSAKTLDQLYEKTLAAVKNRASLCVTLKLVQHVRANLKYYVEYFAAKEQVKYFCTDHLEDAIKIRLLLRNLGKDQRIILLYANAPEFADLYMQYEIEPCVFDPWWIEQALQYRSHDSDQLKIHLWIDVGMAREGMLPADIPRILPLLADSSIIVEGLATHFNMAEQDRDVQKSRFEEVRSLLEDNGIHPQIMHAVGSHNGLGYKDFADSLAFNESSLEVLYDMVRPGCSLGMGVRFDLANDCEDVLRITIPVRAARVAHVKDVPDGWNLGYVDNKFLEKTRVAVLEGTRLNVLRFETFARHSASDAETIKSLLGHARVACLDLRDEQLQPGDVVTCQSDILISFLTRSFRQGEDGMYLIPVFDAGSGNLTEVPVRVRKVLPRDHLFYHADQIYTVLFQNSLERLRSRKRIVRATKTVLVYAGYLTMLVVQRIPIVSRKVMEYLSPVSLS